MLRFRENITNAPLDQQPAGRARARARKSKVGKALFLVITSVLVLHSAFSGGSLQGADQPPNIVLIISDDQAWTDYGFMGHTAIHTPHLDRLASQSMVYTRGYVPTSLCRPSLATVMTGLYPHQHGITGNDPPGEARNAARRAGMVEVFKRSKPLTAWLRQKGYVSHQSGTARPCRPRAVSRCRRCPGEQT